ncbi:hypothetical protein [Mycoplasmoides gallisepticum]|uniref:hypothetical protein n=1 Tax=Mycoplasmoides gallisepticum TaxID=2096 RepID=UPI001650E602|nr:hypothetical protein [Mycoplasmoides gallisepticum]
MATSIKLIVLTALNHHQYNGVIKIPLMAEKRNIRIGIIKIQITNHLTFLSFNFVLFSNQFKKAKIRIVKILIIVKKMIPIQFVEFQIKWINDNDIVSATAEYIELI